MRVEAASGRTAYAEKANGIDRRKETRMQRVRARASRVAIVWALAAVAAGGCAAARSEDGDWPAASPRLYRNDGEYVPNPVDHDFGSQGP